MNVWTRFVDLLDKREDVTPLAVARIVAGITIFQHLVTMWTSGTADGVWVSSAFGGIKSSDLDWLDFIGGATPANVHLLVFIGILGSALMTVGLFSRVSVVFTYLSFRILTGLNSHSGGSSDDLLINGLFLLMFSGCGGALSLDNRGKPAKLAPVWPRYVMIGQLFLVYWTTGLQKVSAAWLPGGELDALWYIFQQPSWQRVPMYWLAPFFQLTRIGTFVAWTFEWSAPVLMLAFWYRYTRERKGRVRAFFNRFDIRTKYLLAGVMVHTGIWVTMEVGPFFGGVLVLYAACFTADEYRAFAARLLATSALQRLRRSPSVPS